MVDNGARAELGDSQESRPREILLAILRLTPARNECRKRETRKAVTGQETFTGEIAVTVEIGLDDVFRLREKPDLLLSLAAEPFRLFLLFRTAGGLFGGVPIQLRRSLVPVGDGAVQLIGDNRVLGACDDGSQPGSSILSPPKQANICLF